MVRKRQKEKEFLDKSKKILKLITIISTIILTIIYCIDGGFYSLLFDLKESKTVIIYSVVIIILLVLLILFNISDEPSYEGKRKDVSSYLTVGIIILIIIFAILLIFTLIDFFLPIIVLSIILFIAYYIVNKIIVFLVNKYGIK